MEYSALKHFPKNLSFGTVVLAVLTVLLIFLLLVLLTVLLILLVVLLIILLTVVILVLIKHSNTSFPRENFFPVTEVLCSGTVRIYRRTYHLKKMLLSEKSSHSISSRCFLSSEAL